MNLGADLQEADRFLFLYSTTPPRANSTDDRIRIAVDRLVERTKELNLHGVVVYDVQDEQERTREERPFPFLPTLASDTYAGLLRRALPVPLITYKCISGLQEENWLHWLSQCASDNLKYVSVVGRASSKVKQDGMSLSRALQLASEHPANFTLGGVVIPERHSTARSESDRLLYKSKYGCQYFISQAIYAPETAIQLIRDYAEECRRQQIKPKRLFLTFTPCGYEKTLEFMKWLGIKIPNSTAHRIATSDSPVSESIKICIANCRRIIDAVNDLAVPIGINVESVSIRKDEIVGSIELQSRLAAIVME